MGCIYGIGFPPFRGGLLKYADSSVWRACVKKRDATQPITHCMNPPSKFMRWQGRPKDSMLNMKTGESL